MGVVFIYSAAKMGAKGSRQRSDRYIHQSCSSRRSKQDKNIINKQPDMKVLWETHFLQLLVLTRRGAAPVKISTGMVVLFLANYHRILPSLLPVLARYLVKFLTLSTVLVIF